MTVREGKVLRQEVGIRNMTAEYAREEPNAWERQIYRARSGEEYGLLVLIRGVWFRTRVEII